MNDPNPTKGNYVQAAASILAGLMVVNKIHHINNNCHDRGAFDEYYDEELAERALDLLVRIEQEVDERMEEGEL